MTMSFADMQAQTAATAPVSGSPFGTPASPFGQPTGAQPAGDLFGQPDLASPTGKYTKVATLDKELVLIAPQRIEQQNKYKSDEKEDVLIASLIILTGPNAGTEIDEWQTSATKFVRIGKSALAERRQYVLGRVAKIPTWDAVKAGKFADGDTQAIEQALAAWFASGGKGEKPGFAWTLARFNEQDAAIATAYLTK